MQKNVDYQQENPMPQIGFKCPLNGENVTIEKNCITCNFRDSVCGPLPYLQAQLAGVREVKEGVYSVTEILNPRQSIYLTRNNDYYLPPDSSLWASFGTAMHKVMERGVNAFNGRFIKCLPIIGILFL